MANELVFFLKQFHKFSAEDEAMIDAAIERRFYKEGDLLFKSGQVCREMFFVCSGVLCIKKINETGNEVINFFIQENKFCSILNSFNNQTRAEENIQAACDTEVIVLKRAVLNQLYIKLDYLKTLITEITHQALLDKIALKNSYLGHDSTSRYRLFLKSQPEVAYRVSIRDIASYLGITPQSLSRIRKNIK